METSSIAIWVGLDGQLYPRTVDTPHEPETEEILVEVKYSGVNPGDVKHGMGLGILDTVAGYDFCGKVIKAGPNSKYHSGNSVFGQTPSGLGRSPKYGAHQRYLICPDSWAYLLPDSLPNSHAACLSVACRTTGDALFNLLRLPLPEEEQPSSPSGPILIWGGSSGLGFTAIQYCKASRVSPILVTASKPNHEALRGLGADYCFDYSNANVVEQIRETVSRLGLQLLHVFDAVGTEDSKPSSAELAKSCGNEGAIFVSSVVQPGGALLPVPCSEVDFHIDVNRGPGKIIIPARVEDAQRSIAGLLWAVAHYGNGFVIPNVRVVDGTVDDAIKCLNDTVAKGSNFGKYVIKHPMRQS